MVFASTGRPGFDNGADTWGTIYTIDVAFAENGDPTGADISVLYDGDQDMERTLRSPDNLDWADNGLIYVQEDAANDVFAAQGNANEASIVRLDPDQPGGDPLRIAEINRNAVVPAGSTDSEPEEVGAWETPGILDVSDLFGREPGTLHVFDVEGHTIKDGVIAEKNLVQGGQLAFLNVNDRNSGPSSLPRTAINDETPGNSSSNDPLNGGGDADKFVFTGGREIIRNFTPGEDIVDISAFGFDTLDSALAFAEKNEDEIFI